MNKFENSVAEKDFRQNIASRIPLLMWKDFQAEANSTYLISTLGGVVQMVLPKTPKVMDEVAWYDVSHSFGRNNFVIRHSTDMIEGFMDDLTCNHADESGVLLYTGPFMGWRLM